MPLLAIETSLAPGSVAVGDGEGVRLRLAPDVGRDFATWLAPAVRQALASADRAGEPPAAIAVALGPGSFTGLRVGLACAKGLCMARGLPLVGVPTADLVAVQTPLHDAPLHVLVPFNAREVYATRYRSESGRWVGAEPARLLPFVEFLGSLTPPAIVAGPIRPDHRDALSRVYHQHVLVYAHLRPDSPPLCGIAWSRLQRGETLAPAEAVPHYVSDPTPVRRARGEAI